MPHFIVSDIAADYAHHGQKKAGSSPNNLSLLQYTLLYLIVSCFHSHGNLCFVIEIS
jgi:hypothetical protein